VATKTYDVIDAGEMLTIEQTKGCINFQLRETSRLLARYYGDALRPVGLRITEFNVFAIVGPDRADYDRRRWLTLLDWSAARSLPNCP